MLGTSRKGRKTPFDWEPHKVSPSALPIRKDSAHLCASVDQDKARRNVSVWIEDVEVSPMWTKGEVL